MERRSFRACSISASGKQGLTNQSRGEEVGRKKLRWRTYQVECYLRNSETASSPPRERIRLQTVISSLSTVAPHPPFSLLSMHKHRSHVNIRANAKRMTSTMWHNHVVCTPWVLNFATFPTTVVAKHCVCGLCFCPVHACVCFCLCWQSHLKKPLSDLYSVAENRLCHARGVHQAQ